MRGKDPARSLPTLSNQRRSLVHAGRFGISFEELRAGAGLLPPSGRGMVWRLKGACFNGEIAPRFGPQARGRRSMPAGRGVGPAQLGARVLMPPDSKRIGCLGGNPPGERRT